MAARRKRLTYGSVFTGVGGFDKGFDNAGMECKFQIEFDKKCQQVLERHWPGVPRFGNVEEVDGKQLPRVDVLCGGFPCQDLSLAGKRKGLAGSRSGLWFQFWRLIRELAPPCVVIENVPGLLSSHGGRDFAILLGGLAGRIPGIPRDGWRNSGFVRGAPYNVAWRIVDSQYHGLAQRRARVFIVASLGNGRCAQVLLEPEGLCWDTAPGRKAQEGVAGGAQDGAGIGGSGGGGG